MQCVPVYFPIRAYLSDKKLQKHGCLDLRMMHCADML